MPITTFTPPEDCTVSNLPVVSFDDCFPQVNLSEITNLYIARQDAIDFTDASVIDEWTDRLSETNTVPTGSSVDAKDLIRPLTVLADKPAPTVTEKAISGGRTQVTKVDHVINVDIDESTAENYEFARATQYGAGAYKVKVWYKTLGGMMYGGNAGVTAYLLLNPVNDRGQDNVERFTGTVKWIEKVSPDRFVSPI